MRPQIQVLNGIFCEATPFLLSKKTGMTTEHDPTLTFRGGKVVGMSLNRSTDTS